MTHLFRWLGRMIEKRDGPSIHKEALEALPEGIVEFGIGRLKIEDEEVAEGNYKKAYAKLKNIYTKGRIEENSKIFK